MTGLAVRSERAVAPTGALAPGLFVLLWSTGFVGAKYGLPYADPFTFLCIRLALAGALLATFARLAGAPFPSTGAGYRHAAVAGLLLHAGYLGGLFHAMAGGVPAGIAALIVGLQPVLTAALAPALLGERVGRRQWLGLTLGVAGVGLVLSHGLAAAAGSPGALSPGGVAACLLALASTTAGTFYQKRYGGRVPLLSGTAIQYAAASGVLLVAAAATEPMRVRWTPHFTVALAWLVVVLSIGAVPLLLTLLRAGTAAGVSSLFYLVPPATAIEAYLLFGERLSVLAVIGMVVAAVGVALVRAPDRR